MDASGQASQTTFAAELRRLRQRARLTLEALADASGVSARTIGGLERGHSLGPQRRTVMALADGLNLDEADREALERLAEVGRPRPVTAPAGWCAPPRPVADFAGREDELVRLAALAAGQGHAASVVVLSGPGGIGKTTLAVEAGRRLADDKGFALFYLDLRGLDDEPLDPVTALFRLLKALGVGNRDMPDDVDGRSGQFRALLEERPAVVVLDNARDEEQVRPLLPGAGPGLALVASRRLLTGLEGVARLPVPVLDSGSAVGLLRSIIGGADGNRSEGLAELAALCGGLPLALRIIGNRLATRPGWTARQLADRLADSERRLERIHAGDLQITAAFGMSYDHLSPAAQRLCRRLALVPGPDFAPPLASVLIGASVEETEELLDELHELGLLSQVGDIRYGFHDLIRLFAGDRLAAEEDEAQREASTKAMVEWLVEVTVTAGRWFEPDYGAAPQDWGLPVDLSTSEAATAWLQAEADNWLGAVRIAAAHGWDRQVVDTAEALHWFSDHWLAWAHWFELFSLAASAAERMGDAVAQATQLNYVSWALAARGENKQAHETALRAVRIAEQAGDIQQKAWGFNYAAAALLYSDPAAALPHAQDAERLFAQAGDFVAHLQALQTVAFALTQLERPHEAIEKLHEALEMARVPQTTAARQLVADIALFSGARHLAWSYTAVGDDALAEDFYRNALADVDRLDLPFQQAGTEVRLAGVLHRRGRPDEATSMLHTARARFLAVDAAAQVAEIDEQLEQWRDGQ
ncbi:transcriptional regulator with XRE-family HTH domain/tetratricopeptide (TPR) repeat protein [Catenulispora sp. GP43]|uniref:helix-turn-helix domain-containing protein n=1 Tax=Catenulispora sp. GP43 TaxID=3156263 RepID=UPI003512B79C